MLDTILTALLALFSAVLTGVIIPYIKSKTTLMQRETALSLISSAVTAAEQIYSGGGNGTAKKKFVREWLELRGIAIDEAEINALVESAVYALKNG